MATITNGTLILRPDASKGTGIVTVPSGIAVEECYKLVNEETADYESTYITIPTGANICLHFSLPPNIKITAFDSSTTVRLRGVARDVSENANGSDLDIKNDGGTEHLCRWSDKTSLAPLTFFLSMAEPILSVELQPIGSSIVAMTNEIVDALHNNDFAYEFILNSSTDSKIDVRLSQIYLEISNVTYEEVSDTGLPIFFKQSGSWVSIIGTLYQKQNGAWVECDTSVLTSGTQYDIEEL